MKNNNTKKLAACAVMVALGAVLSMIKVLQMPFGGSITLLSMLPCAMISIMYGLKWGFAASFVESVVQLAFGITMDGILGWGMTPSALIGTILLDYIVAYTVIGIAGIFRKKGYVGICCGTALAIASNFQQAGITAGTDAGKAGFLTALYVVLVPVFGLFFRRKVSLPVWVAVALSVVSLYLLCIKGSFRLAAGDLLVLVCAVCFAVHILVIDHFGATCDGVKLSCVQFLFAGLWSAVCIPFFEHVDAAALLSCALPLLYVGVFSCGVGYTLQILAQKDSNPTVVTILLSLESVFAVIAGAIILHQHMTPREYLGCALMFLAVVLAQIPLPAKAARAGK